MDKLIRTDFDNLRSEDKAVQNDAFTAILSRTDKPVDWAYDVWNDLKSDLTHKDNHRRAIAAQVLCNLAKSDPQNRMVKDFNALLAVTRDERFVTARHCMQSLWKVGAAGKAQQRVLVKGLELRYHECASEKNCTLIRYDIIVALRNLYDAVPDEAIKTKSLALIEQEPDTKYRKKYATVWRKHSTK